MKKQDRNYRIESVGCDGKELNRKEIEEILVLASEIADGLAKEFDDSEAAGRAMADALITQMWLAGDHQGQLDKAGAASKE